METRVFTVGSRKGGVGKTTLAYELASLRGAVLVDFEWDGSSVSRRWGYRHEDRVRDSLLDALERGRTPRPLLGKGHKADLVPGSPHLVDAGLSLDDYADALQRWAGEWGRDLVVDTHPGASEPAHGAMAASSAIIVPTTLRVDDLNGTEQMLQDLADYPLVVVPNMVRRVPPRAEIIRLAAITKGRAAVAPPLPYATAIERRKKRIAMTAESPTPKSVAGFVEALTDVSRFLEEYTNGD